MSANVPPHTVCLRSQDATKLEEGVFQWRLVSQNLKAPSTKVMLASIELPLSQMSIEPETSRVHFVERLVLTPGRRTLRVGIDLLDAEEGGGSAEALLPLHLNRIESMRTEGAGDVRVRLRDPHGLFGGVFEWSAAAHEEHVKLICTGMGTVDVSSAWREGRLEIVSADELLLHDVASAPATASSFGRGGFLHVPSPASPASLADLATRALRHAAPQLSLESRFDADDCRFEVRAAGGRPGSGRVRMRVGGDSLASLLGFDTAGERVFSAPAPPARTTGYLGYATQTQRGFLTQHMPTPQASLPSSSDADADAVALRGDATSLFGFASIRPGWYAPSQRIYNAAPLRMPEEFELQLARLVFPAEEPMPGLVYTDPHGTHRIAELLPGVYTPSSLAAFLTAMMNRASEEDGAPFRFRVRHEAEGVPHFVLSCHDGQGEYGVVFDVNFAHPRSIAARKLGFSDAAVLEGSDTYRSSEPVAVAASPFGPPSNLYQISEAHGQRKFAIRSSAPPSVVAVAEDLEHGGRVLRLRCLTPRGGKPTAHGLLRGAVVHLSAAAGGGDVAGQGDVVHRSVPRGSIALAVVERGAESDAVSVLHVEVPPLPWIREAAERACCLSVTAGAAPCSFCFCDRLPRTIGGHRLGFPPTTVQWGVDGSVRTRALRVPPFVSSGCHNLDHVDYVLLRLREGKKSTLIQHETNGQTSSVLGKVCLNPVFRNERHLPVETSVNDRMDTVTIEVLNPDQTRYKFNDAAWSLSLTFFA